MWANAYDFLKETVKSMKRQKLEPGSLHIVYLFQHQLTFTPGLGNHKKTLSYGKVV